MTPFAALFAVFTISFATSLMVARRLTRVNVRGRHPERSRHWSASGIPRIGGIAVFVAAPAAILLGMVVNWPLTGAAPRFPELAGALTIASAILFAIGLLDDLRGAKPALKLFAQAGAALVVCSAGFAIQNLTFAPGHAIHLGAFAIPVTMLWLVGISNAFNLVDGLDGLAGGIAIIALLAVAPVGVILHNDSVVVYAVALIGALAGFLRYNRPPAKLYMGDSGSLVVGFVLAVLSVRGSTDLGGVTHGLIPIFALAYPLLDTGVAILRRWLRGVPLSRADRRHVHHQLCVLGLAPAKALATIYAAAVGIAALGLVIGFAPPQVVVLATLIGVAILILVMGYGIYWLEYHEFLEAGASFAHAVRKARVVIQDKINARDLADSLRGARDMGELQTLLLENADTFRFAYMKLSDPFTRRQAATSLSQELQALKLWKLEYPILQRVSDEYDGLCLTIWSTLSNRQRPAGAERVARILAPAIAEWIGGAKRNRNDGYSTGISANGNHASNGDRQRAALMDLRMVESEKQEPSSSTLEA